MALCTVVMHVFNQEKMISKSIESILNQKTSFPIDIKILDDGSLDKTPEILKEFSKKHENINIITLKKNTGCKQARITALGNITSQFVACIDADDFWIDESKLQYQIDFLRTHKDFSMVVHNALIQYNDGRQETLIRPKLKSTTVTTDDIVYQNFFAQYSSFVYRNTHDKRLYKIFKEEASSDWLLLAYFSLLGKIHFVNKNWSIYSYTNEGGWTGASQQSKLDQTLRANTTLYKMLTNPKQQALVLGSIATIASDLKSLLSNDEK